MDSYPAPGQSGAGYEFFGDVKIHEAPIVAGLACRGEFRHNSNCIFPENMLYCNQSYTRRRLCLK